MRLRPYLLEPGCLYDEDPENLVTSGLLDLGRITRRGRATPVEIQDADAAVSPRARIGWRRVMALEWLLAATTEANDVAAALAPFADEPLAMEDDATAPTARELAASCAAIALAPLASQSGGAAGVAALIVSPVVQGLPPDRRIHWQDSANFPHLDGCRLDALVTPHPSARIDGASWQLSAALAARALRCGRPGDRLSLAADWLPTGALLTSGKIQAIDYGNKPSLPVTQRRWLIPASAPEIPPAIRQSGYAPAQTLDIAWNHVTRQGTIEEGGSQSWPEGVEELHSFVSGAREPVIAAALLANVPRLVLWRTSNEDVSRKPAEDIQHILAALAPALKVELRDSPSDSMHAIELCLETELGAPLKAGRPLLFNVTQGNRMMGFAAHTLARRYPSLWLLYRDNDNKGTDFSAIRYDGRDFPVTFTLSAEATDQAVIDWQKLLKSRSPPQIPPWQELLVKIRPSGGKPC